VSEIGPGRPASGGLFRQPTYALFHFLVAEAIINWKKAEQRQVLARLFDHGKMKAASDKQRAESRQYLKFHAAPSPELDRARSLYQVSNTFFEIQHERHNADYNNLRHWTRTEVLNLIDRVEAALELWPSVRETSAAQAYLLSLLGGL
jgi:hypothetical protein